MCVWTCHSHDGSTEEARGVIESHPPDPQVTKPERDQAWPVTVDALLARSQRPCVTRGAETILGRERPPIRGVRAPAAARSRGSPSRLRAEGSGSKAGPRGLVSMRSTDGGRGPGPKS